MKLELLYEIRTTVLIPRVYQSCHDDQTEFVANEIYGKRIDTIISCMFVTVTFTMQHLSQLKPLHLHEEEVLTAVFTKLHSSHIFNNSPRQAVITFPVSLGGTKQLQQVSRVRLFYHKKLVLYKLIKMRAELASLNHCAVPF